MGAAERIAPQSESRPLLKINRGEDENENSAKDAEGREQSEAGKAEFERAAREAIAAFRNAASLTLIISERDVQEFADTTFNEQMWRLRNMEDYSARAENLRESTRQYIPKLLSETKSKESDFINQVNEAVQKGWVSTASGERWKGERLKSGAVRHWEKELFLREKWPTYYKGMKKAGESMDKLKKLQATEGLKDGDVPELAMVHAPGFIDQHHSIRSEAIDKAIAALTAREKGKTDLYQLACKQLDDAVKKGALAPSKVGTWLRRIFESSAKPELMEKFLKGSDSTSLSVLIWKWQQAAHQFDKVEEKRMKAKPQPRFNFVQKTSFLEMHYTARLAYIQEANFRFRNIDDDHHVLLDIRRDLDMKDWDSAEATILYAKSCNLSPQDKTQLGSLEKFLNEHRPAEETDTDVIQFPFADCDRELLHILKQVENPDLHSLIFDAARMGPGVLRCLAALLYNRKWTHEHGYLDGDREQELRERATEETLPRIPNGHDKGFENNNGALGGSAIRDFTNGEWSAQVLHMKSSGHGSLLARMKRQQDNHAFKYWTTLIPEGVDYEQHLYVVDSIMPQVRSCLRKWEGQKKKAA